MDSEQKTELVDQKTELVEHLHNMLPKAIAFAAEVYKYRSYHNTVMPYILHPLGTLTYAKNYTSDKHVLTASILYGVVEYDQTITFSTIEEQFGKRVRELVEELTWDESFIIPNKLGEYHIKRLPKLSHDALLIYLCANLENLTTLRRFEYLDRQYRNSVDKRQIIKHLLKDEALPITHKNLIDKIGRLL
jgi:(p)ppGpp synthase/HD superfamily hydrolase